VSRGCADKTNTEPRRDRNSSKKFSHVVASRRPAVAGGYATCT
jgi:hypothetical protein